jgi:hypothetical protein
MKIIDTYDDVLNLFQKSNDHFNKSTWKEYAEAISKGLSEKCLSDSDIYNFENDVLPIIETALNSKEKLEKLHSSFLLATKELKERFEKVFGIDISVDIILYLGLCNGAGWVTKLNGVPTILLGIEKIIELDWVDDNSMTALIYHEIGHIWHDVAGVLYHDKNSISEKSLWQLYQEGIAMYCEQLLIGDFSYYHQDKYGWLGWCSKNMKDLFIEYKKRVDKNESTQDFFGDWCNYLGYSDVGYYLGCELIKNLSSKHSLAKLANLEIDDIYIELCNIVN